MAPCAQLPDGSSSMMKSEEGAIRRLKDRNLDTDPETVDELRRYFRHLRELERSINAISPRRLYEAQWAILGLIARGCQSSLCCIEMLAEGNWNGFHASARGLLETVCAAAWTLQNVERLPSLVRQEQVKPGKMLNAGYSKRPCPKELYGEFSAIVHPPRDGHLLSFNSDALERNGIIVSFSMSLSDSLFKRHIKALRVLLLRFVMGIRELANLKEHSIRTGNVMAELRPRMET